MLQKVRQSALWPMLRKEFIQMRRDRFTLGMMAGVPAIQILLFGFAIRTEVRNLPMVILDESRSAESRALKQAMANTRSFRLSGEVDSREEIRRRIERGEARAALIIPPDFETDIKRRRTATAQVIVDAADPLASSAAISGAVMAGANRSAVLLGAGARRPPLELRVRPWYNPAMESSIYIVPGVIAILLTMTMTLVTALALVRERERGTLEQLIVTPISRSGLMLGKLLPFVLVGYTQMTIVLLVGRFIFGVPMRGNVGQLYIFALPFIVGSLGIGLLISTVTRTQTQALQLGFPVLLPTILLSGFMFPREAMPEVAQWIGAAFPVTYFLEVLRGILLRGAGIEALWPQLLILGVSALLLVLVATLRFRKTLE
ncbi:MAG: ABC transporter permease [Gemmatimonadota bacterium]